jgi:hypothetical protein
LAGIPRPHIDLDGGFIKVFRREMQQIYLIRIYRQAREIIERRLNHIELFNWKNAARFGLR